MEWGGVNATKKYADLSADVTLDHVTWVASTNTLSWDQSYSNSFALQGLSGDFSAYKTITINATNYSSGNEYRLIFYGPNFDGGQKVLGPFYSNGGTYNLSDRGFTEKELSSLTSVNLAGGSATGSIIIERVYFEKPTTLDFDETGKAYIDLTDISVSDGNLSYDDQTGTVTSTGTGGTINITFDRAYDLSGMTHWTATMTGDDIVEHWKLVGATNNGSALDMYSGEFDRAFPGSLADPDFTAITGITMYVNASGTLTFSDGGIYITSSVINASDGAYSSTALTKDMFKKWTSSDADASESDETFYPTVNLGTAQGTGSTIFGDPSVSHLTYADISEFDELVINGTPNKNVRAFFNRETATSAGRPDATQMMDAEGNTTFDLAAIKAEYGFVHLNVIKIPYDGGTERTINSLTLRKKNTGAVYNYTFSGNGVLSKSALAALADETATAIDATGITAATELTTANPNCLIVANAGMVTNTQNVIVDGTCANLVLTDKKPFKAPASFTATTATLNREVNNGGFATICAPFAITGATGTFYQPSELTAEGVLNFATEATPAAGKAYLFKASDDVTAFTGSGTVVAEPIENGEGVVMKGTFSQIAKVDEGSYILNGSSLYKVDSDVALAPFRAYFEVPAVAPARINLHFDEETTGIEAVNSSMNNVEGYYNLNGQRVAQTTKGLYIVNGKKVMVK